MTRTDATKFAAAFKALRLDMEAVMIEAVADDAAADRMEALFRRLLLAVPEQPADVLLAHAAALIEKAALALNLDCQ